MPYILVIDLKEAHSLLSLPHRHDQPPLMTECGLTTEDFAQHSITLTDITDDLPEIYSVCRKCNPKGPPEEEVYDVLSKPWEDRIGKDDSRVAIGQTAAGRYLRVIYVPDPEPDSAFVITAYDLGTMALKAFKRRRKRKS